MRLLLLLATLSLSCDGGFQNECECFACLNAITLNVRDADGNDVRAWVMESTLDGVRVDDFGACDPETRIGSTCSFGTEGGVYRIVIRAPGFRTREMAVRFAAPSGASCCQCLQAITVNAVLERVE